MTHDEMEQLEQRMEKAEAAKDRMERLLYAAAKLADGVASVEIDFVGGLISYVPVGGEKGWVNVCWASKESGLIEEIRGALMAILERRAAEAEADFAAA